MYFRVKELVYANGNVKFLFQSLNDLNLFKYRHTIYDNAFLPQIVNTYLLSIILLNYID